MTNDLPERFDGFLAPPYDDGKRLCWDLSGGGVRRLAVSDGRMLLAVVVPDDGTPRWLPTSTVDPQPDPRPLLEAPPSEGTSPLAVPVAALLEWCGPESSHELELCRDCNGSGKCECQCCYDVHPCGSCKGTRWARKPLDPLHGRLLGLRVDRHRLRRLLSRGSGQCVVTVRKRPPGERNKEEANFVRVDGDDWTAMLMSMEDDASVPCPVFEESPCPA